MAKYGKSLAQVVVEINGQKQVNNILNAMKGEAEALRGSLKAAQDELRNLATGGSQEDYNKKLKEVNGLKKELKQLERSINETHKLNVDFDDILGNMSKYSASTLMKTKRQIEAILRSMPDVTDEQRKKMREMHKDLIALTEEIDRRKGKLVEFEDIMDNLNSVDDRSLDSVIKRLKDLIATTDKVDVELLKKYTEQLEKAEEVKYRRTATKAEGVMYGVEKGQFKGTIAETEEAISLMKQYQNVMKDTSPESVQRVENTIRSLNERLLQAKSEMLSFEEAVRQADKISSGTWDGTLEDLEKLKRSLEYFRKNKLEIKGDHTKLKAIEAAFSKIEKTSKQVGFSMADVEDAIENIHTAPVEKLEKAASFLKEEVLRAQRGTEDYIRATIKLRQVESAIAGATKEWKAQENQIIKTGKRLASYVAVYGGYNFIAGKIREVTQANLQLSDSIADIQKTTGLSREEVSALGKELDKIDTRSTQENLYQLAAAAGQLGLKSQEDILGFTKASNMITVALNELGSEGVTTLLKIANLTGEATNNIEGALLSIGSSINELTANSAATAGPITEFISRVGGVASQANLTTHELAALGATADAAGQHMEVSGTSMSKIIATLKRDAKGVSEALNIDFATLDSLMRGGNTMEAILMVFEAMQREGGASAAALKALGSEGERMNTFVAAMVQNLDNLKRNLEISSKAYTQATSIQNEYNIKNNNAIGILQRLQNTIMEIFSNPAMVNFLTGVMNSLKSFVDWFLQSETAIKLVSAALLQMMGLKIIAFIGGLIKGYKEFVAILKVSTTGLRAFHKQLTVVYRATMIANGGVHKLRVAFVGLFRVLAKHPVALLATAVTALATSFINFGDSVDEATDAVTESEKAQANLRAQHQKERDELNSLVQSIERANDGTKTRSELISEFNSKYSKYLGYQLDDKAGTDDLRLATQLLNVELEKRQQLELFKVQRQGAEQKSMEDTTEALAVFTSMLSDAGVSQETIGRTISYLNDLIDKGLNYQDIWKNISEFTGVAMHQWERGAEAPVATGFFGTDVKKAIDVQGDSGASEAEKKVASEKLALYNLIKIRRDYKSAMQRIDEQQAGATKQLDEETFNAQKAALSLQFEELRKMTGEEGAELEARKAAYRKFYDTLNGYMKDSTGEQKKWYEQIKATFEGIVRDTPKLANVIDAYGKNNNIPNWTSWIDTVKNIDKASIESLVQAYKDIEEDTKIITADIEKFNQMRGTEYKSQQEALDDVWKKSRQIEAQLKKYHRNTSGGFLSETDGSGDKKTKARQDYKAAMDALKAYYNEYEDFIRQKRANNKITEEDMNRQIMDNDRKFHEDRQQLIKKFLGEENTFDASIYEGVLSGYDYFADKNLDEMAKFYQKNGDALEDGARKQITESGVIIREAFNKEQEKIKKELLKGDFFATYENNFAKMLDELGALTSKAEEKLYRDKNEAARKSGSGEVFGISPEERKLRIAALLEFADESYQIDANGLKEKMLLKSNYSKWVEDMEEEDMQVLLQNLREYYSQRILLTKRYQEEMDKEFEAYYKQSGKQHEYDKKIQGVSESGAMNEWLESFGIPVDYKDKMKVIVDKYNAEMEKNVERIKKAKEKANAALKDMEEADVQFGSDSEQYRNALARYEAAQNAMTEIQQENNQLRAENERQQTQIYLEEWKKRAEKMGEWATEFGDYLGEEVMLSKQANDARARGDEETAKKIEQQREQNKQALIQNLLSMIVDEAALWAKEYALKMMFNSMMISEEKKKAVEEATLQGKSSMLSIFLSALTGQAAEAKIGLPGLITGAVVFAATMALQAMAKSAISNMFPEAAVGSTSSRKLSTGMLTYADGNYPVLGNDGKVYDAKYEGAGMKTGVYGGGAHFGIFSEKQPEMIVDGKTTQKIILNYPYIYDAITTIAKNGRLKNAMPTFAAGDYPAGMKQLSKAVAVDGGASSSPNEERMVAALEQSQAVNNQLLKLLQGGITAHLDGLETHRQQKKNERFLKRRGID